MNLLKKFYLFIAGAPFSSAFFIVFVPSAFALLQLAIFCEQTGKDTLYFKNHFVLGLIAACILFLIFGFINLIVIRSKVTKVDVKANELALIHHPAPGNEVEISRRSVWGKYLKSIIRFPLDWEANVEQGDENYFHAGITIIINSDVRLFISVTFNFVFSGPFEAEDLYFKFMNGRILDDVDVDKFMVETFSDLNLSGDTYLKMSQDAKSYYNANMSKREFIDCISHTIKFPKLFSNVAATGLTIEKVKLNYSTLIEED